MLTLQVCAMAFGAVVDAFLAMDEAWTDNAFYYAMRETWPVGPILLAAGLLLRAPGQASASRRRQPRRQPNRARRRLLRTAAETVSSHSVP